MSFREKKARVLRTVFSRERIHRRHLEGALRADIRSLPSGPFCVTESVTLTKPKLIGQVHVQGEIELLSMGEAKPEGFQTGGFPIFFRERSRLCRGPFRDSSSWALLIGGERGKDKSGNPRKVPGQIGKIPEKSGKSQKGQKRKDKSRSGTPPRLEPPGLAALDLLSPITANFGPPPSKMYQRICCAFPTQRGLARHLDVSRQHCLPTASRQFL